MVTLLYKLRIKIVRIKNGLTQKELAKKLNMSQNYFSELENGKYDIKLSTLCEIAKILDVDPNDLFVYKKD